LSSNLAIRKAKSRDYDRGTSYDSTVERSQYGISSRRDRSSVDKVEARSSLLATGRTESRAASRAESRAESRASYSVAESRAGIRSSSRLQEDRPLRSVDKPVVVKMLKSVQVDRTFT